MRRLLIRPGAIGDTILGFPALQHLSDGDTEIWVRSEVVPLVKFGGRVRALSSTGLNMMEIDPPARTVANLERFDEIWSWYGANNRGFREAVRRFPFRFLAALPEEEGRAEARHHLAAGRHPARHAADFFAEQVDAPLPAAPRILVEPDAHGAVVAHPYSGSKRKNWPYERFEELRRRVPLEWAHDRFDDLHDLARWLAGARLFVGNDSGITHLAAAVGTPVIALFGPSDPAVWAPRGPRVTVLRRDPLDSLSVDEVERAVRQPWS